MKVLVCQSRTIDDPAVVRLKLFQKSTSVAKTKIEAADRITARTAAARDFLDGAVVES